MKKNIFIIFLFVSGDFKLYSQSDLIDCEQLFDQEENNYDQQMPQDFVIKTTPRVFVLKDIPLYIKITALGLYESKLKPWYYIFLAYLKSISLKFKK